MDAKKRQQLTALEAALEARDVDAVMRLTGTDRFDAEFMIAVGHGDIDGCVPPEREPQRPPSARTPAARSHLHESKARGAPPY